MVTRQFVAVKALIFHEGKLLLVRESKKSETSTQANTYGLVGGRVNIGEDYKSALKREVNEETGLEINIDKPIHVDEWQPTLNNEQWQIIGIFFVCSTDNNKIILSNEHESFLWIDPNEYAKYTLITESKNAIEKYLNLDNQ